MPSSTFPGHSFGNPWWTPYVSYPYYILTYIMNMWYVVIEWQVVSIIKSYKWKGVFFFCQVVGFFFLHIFWQLILNQSWSNITMLLFVGWKLYENNTFPLLNYWKRQISHTTDGLCWVSVRGKLYANTLSCIVAQWSASKTHHCNTRWFLTDGLKCIP